MVQEIALEIVNLDKALKPNYISRVNALDGIFKYFLHEFTYR
jgi:hypothetical protein